MTKWSCACHVLPTTACATSAVDCCLTLDCFCNIPTYPADTLSADQACACICCDSGHADVSSSRESKRCVPAVSRRRVVIAAPAAPAPPAAPPPQPPPAQRGPAPSPCPWHGQLRHARHVDTDRVYTALASSEVMLFCMTNTNDTAPKVLTCCISACSTWQPRSRPDQQWTAVRWTSRHCVSFSCDRLCFAVANIKTKESTQIFILDMRLT